jgi:hypothetical protein
LDYNCQLIANYPAINRVNNYPANPDLVFKNKKLWVLIPVPNINGIGNPVLVLDFIWFQF